MRLDRDRPEILQPPDHPQACCEQQTITVPPDVLAKTAQKHDYPSAAWRRSCARRTGAERGFAAAKDPATNDISRGWCRLRGLAPLMLLTTTLLIVRNQQILTHGTPVTPKTSAGPPPGCPPKPANAAARPSPASPQDHPDPAPPRLPAPLLTTRAAPQPGASTRANSTNTASAPTKPGNADTTHPATGQPECQRQT